MFSLISLLIFPYVLILVPCEWSTLYTNCIPSVFEKPGVQKKHATPQPVRAGDGAQKSTLQQRFAELEKDSGLATKSEGEISRKKQIEQC